MTVQTFPTPDPRAGRPRIAEIGGNGGKLGIHVERESKALWLFAEGPQGGDRGRIVVTPERVTALVEWLDAGGGGYLSGGIDGFWMTLREGNAEHVAGVLVVSKPGWMRQWKLILGAHEREALIGFLRQWAAATLGQAITPAEGEPA